jgi:hypothetical protein
VGARVGLVGSGKVGDPTAKRAYEYQVAIQPVKPVLDRFTPYACIGKRRLRLFAEYVGVSPNAVR